MPIEHYRVDDRLVHGQVVVGWGQPLGLGFLVLVDDAVAASTWETDLYRMGTPPGIDLFVESEASVRERMAELEQRPDPGMLLTADIATMDRLSAQLPGIRSVTIGGVHHAAGRSPRLPYVFLSGDDDRALASMAARGVRVTAQDLPGSPEVSLEALLAEGRA